MNKIVIIIGMAGVAVRLLQKTQNQGDASIADARQALQWDAHSVVRKFRGVAVTQIRVAHFQFSRTKKGCTVMHAVGAARIVVNGKANLLF